MKRKSYQLVSALIVLSVLFTQLGVNFLHTHKGQVPIERVTAVAQSDNGQAFCPACSLDGVPMLYVEHAEPVVQQVHASVFAEGACGGILVPLSGPSQGRAPPVI